VVAVGQVVIRHHDLVDGVVFVFGAQADGAVEVPEPAVADVDVRARSGQADARRGRFQSGQPLALLLVEPVGIGVEIPSHVGEHEIQP